MIDLDRMDEELAGAVMVDASPLGRPPSRPAAVTATAPAAPAVRATPAARPTGAAGREPLELDPVDGLRARMAATANTRDRLTWANMLALLAGHQDQVRDGLDSLAALARAARDPETWDRQWTQRYWAAVTWGAEGERYVVLDHCRERAYRFDDLQWWGRLTVLLAGMSKADEATRAFDQAFRLQQAAPREGRWLDTVTDLVEAATLLGDANRAGRAFQAGPWPERSIVLVGDGVICKGWIERYRGMGLAALGRRQEAGRCFEEAEAAHRALGAAPLVARTIQQASPAGVPPPRTGPVSIEFARR